jgi:chromosome segregation ATPase
LDDKHIAPFST